MSQNENVTEVLNDLIRINNDRIEGYGKAVNEVQEDDQDLKSIFNRMIGESQNYVIQLKDEVEKTGGTPAEGATLPGKLYRAWMEVKATFSGKDRHSTLSACEYGEDAAQDAYKKALADLNLPLNITQLLTAQKSALRASHDEIKRFRDQEKVAK